MPTEELYAFVSATSIVHGRNDVVKSCDSDWLQPGKEVAGLSLMA